MPIFGVSFGNGNDGVSHTHFSYSVELNVSDQAFELARLACINEIAAGYQDWAADNLFLDGETDFCISATLYEGPNGEREFETAYFICDVFLIDKEEHWGDSETLRWAFIKVGDLYNLDSAFISELSLPGR